MNFLLLVPMGLVSMAMAAFLSVLTIHRALLTRMSWTYILLMSIDAWIAVHMEWMACNLQLGFFGDPGTQY